MDARLEFFLTHLQAVHPSTMATKSQRQTQGREGTVSTSNAAIEAMDLAEKISSITPAKAVFGTVVILLTIIKVCSLLFRDEMLQFTCNQESVVNELDYVELGLFCVDICRALNRGMDGKKLDDLSQSVRGAINQLTT